MPLTLRPPRKGKSPNYEIRGTYLRVAVERSAGTPDKKLALKVLNRIKAEIEEGKIKGGDGTTFLMALKAYLEAGGDGQFMRPIIELDGEHSLCNRLVADIDQTLLDLAAAALYPNAICAKCWRGQWRMLVSRSRRATAASICSATLMQVGWLASTRWIITRSPAPAAGKTRARLQATFTPTSRRKRSKP
jgi:hypothetical protein